MNTKTYDIYLTFWTKSKKCDIDYPLTLLYSHDTLHLGYTKIFRKGKEQKEFLRREKMRLVDSQTHLHLLPR